MRPLLIAILLAACSESSAPPIAKAPPLVDVTTKDGTMYPGQAVLVVNYSHWDDMPGRYTLLITGYREDIQQSWGVQAALKEGDALAGMATLDVVKPPKAWHNYQEGTATAGSAHGKWTEASPHVTTEDATGTVRVRLSKGQVEGDAQLEPAHLSAHFMGRLIVRCMVPPDMLPGGSPIAGDVADEKLESAFCMRLRGLVE